MDMKRSWTALLLMLPSAAFAQGDVNTGDTAWMLIATALVMLMIT